MARGWILGAAILLASCGGNGSTPKLWTHDEIMDIAGDTAPDTTELEERISTLEARVDDLETRASRQSESLHAQANLTGPLTDEVQRLGRNERVWIEQINYLRALHQRPPMQ